MTTDQKSRDMKELMRHPEWKTYVEHIKDVIQVHCDSSVSYSSKGKHEDASRQAWIAEGLTEAIDEPESVIQEHKFSVKGMTQSICHACGNLFKTNKT
mgnify:CR=1 FL=1